MSEVRITLVVLVTSLGGLIVGYFWQEPPPVVVGFVLAWIALVCSTKMVDDAARGTVAARFWAVIQLVIGVTLPLGACISSIVARTLAESAGRSEMFGVLAALLLPMGTIAVSSSLALNRMRGLVVAIVGGVGMIVWASWMPLKNELLFALAWCAIAITVASQLVAVKGLLPRKPMPTGLCGKCGYDLHGLSRSTPCPECGTQRSPFN